MILYVTLLKHIKYRIRSFILYGIGGFQTFFREALNFRISKKNDVIWHQKLARCWNFAPPTHCVGGDIYETV